MCHNKANGTPKSTSYRDVDLVSVNVEEQTAEQFLTVQSDPGAEHEWQQFHCDDAVRGVQPEFLRSLRVMFAHKPAGTYLVKVSTVIQLTTLDFEAKPIPQPVLTDPDNETQAHLLRAAGIQVEAEAVPSVPFPFDPLEETDLEAADY